MKLKEPKNPKDAISLYDCKDWFDDLPYIDGTIGKELPTPNIDYFYAATKVLSAFPAVNSKGATYELADLTSSVVNSFIATQINAGHRKLQNNIGTVIGAEKTDSGVELLLRFDREQAAFHGISPEDLKRGNTFCKVSLEVSKDPTQSLFYILGDDCSILHKIPYLEGERMGIRRTDTAEATPYLYQGKYRVAECISPLRFTGVGLVKNPADECAQVYAVAADATTKDQIKSEVSMAKETAARMNWPIEKPATPEEVALRNERYKSEDMPKQYDMENDVPDYIDIHNSDAMAMHEVACEYMAASNPKEPYGKNAKYADPGLQADHIKRYPLDSESHVRAATSYFSMPKNRSKYSPEQQAHILKAIGAAKRRFGIGDDPKSNKEGASADALQETPMTAEESARLAALETSLKEFASAKETASAELATLKDKLTEVEREVASVTSERDALKTEVDTLKAAKETAERESALVSLLGELEAIMPAKDEASKTSRKEQASAALGNDLAVKLLKAELQIAALQETAAKKDPEAEEDKDIQKGEKKDEDKDKDEMSKSRKDTFSATPPPVIAVSEYKFDPSKKNYTASEAALLF